MNLGRFAWLLCLALVVFVTLAGQALAPDACEADESDWSTSTDDDSSIAAPVTAPEAPMQTAVRFLRFDLPPPSDRLALADVFRPPNRPQL